jgi:hypothetical protein
MKLLTEYYMWTEIDDKGEEGSIVAMVPDMPLVNSLNLIHRKEYIVKGIMRTIAINHSKATGHEVRLIKWTLPETIEVIDGKAK